MNRCLNQAWGRLLLTLLLSLAFAYAGSSLLTSLGIIKAESALLAASVGVRNVTMPVIRAGAERGIDVGILLFALNSVAAAALALLLFAAPLVDPNMTSISPRLIRKLLLKEDLADRLLFRALRLAPSFRAVGAKDLRPLYVWLYLVPPFVMILLGLEVGTVWAAAGRVLQSAWVSAATLVPHGIFELPALGLAGALAFGTYQRVRDDVEHGRSREVFAAIRRIIRSKDIWIAVTGTAALLLTAAIVESRVTPLVVRWVARY